MSIESFIRAMPKAELNVQLEGAVRKAAWLKMAERNEIPAAIKKFDDWVALLDNPNYATLDELLQTLRGWMLYPDDLTRIVYDVGVALSRQNIKYAEVSVSPILLMLAGMAFDDFLAALNDGRDRAERGWGIRMTWILTVPRDQPRRADDILRWATSVTGRRGEVVAFGLTGKEDLQPIGQFERAFASAQKKDCPRVVQAGDVMEAEGVLEALEMLTPTRIVDGRGIADAPDALKKLVEQGIPVAISMGRALCHGWFKSYDKYPLQRLHDEGIRLIIGVAMPSIYKTDLNDEYLAAVEHCQLGLDELEEIALNAVKFSYMPEEEQTAMIAEFEAAYAQLRDEHINVEDNTEAD
jgi:aminodeoxyfutalosine deaminase